MRKSDAVDLIGNVVDPKVTFTVTISLRLDIFRGVSLAALGSRRVLRASRAQGHRAVFFNTNCQQQLFGRDPTGSSVLDVRNGSCVFAWGASQIDEVITFDTPKTVRQKMVATYQRLGYGKTDKHVIGWTVYNVTLGMAPQQCNGTANRIEQVLLGPSGSVLKS
ncbi:uncharacterized protein LOC142558481 [Dermacentor variabilis]|uniref:uncharacterized protein LOC142558481 n=1 Tax=Dermacentor variabilis TaxID=34621 RepID=UPI003F5B5A3C